MLVECKSFLSDVKELKKEILDWIREFGTNETRNDSRGEVNG